MFSFDCVIVLWFTKEVHFVIIVSTHERYSKKKEKKSTDRPKISNFPLEGNIRIYFFWPEFGDKFACANREQITNIPEMLAHE